jgi:hypothetical protein
MSRQGKQDAQNTYNTADNLTGASTASKGSLYNNLFGTYQNEAVNPTGFNPTDLAHMTTATEQSAGGGLGAATGKAAQYAAANRNLGSFAPALGEASRDASRSLSDATLGIQNKNALLKEGQRQEGISGMQGLENQENNDILASLGIQNNSTEAETNAEKTGWFQNMLGLMNAVGNDATGAGSMGIKMPGKG